MDFEQLAFPEHLHYLVDEDTWARVEDDGSVRVGITSLGVALSGDLFMCRPRPVGTRVEQGRGVAVVELAKSIVSVKSPLSGDVVAVNDALGQQPELVNRDPYGAGWIARLRPLRWDEERAVLVTGAAIGPAMRQHAWLMRQADAPGVAGAGEAP
jgi:glycine cleavage system H protein